MRDQQYGKPAVGKLAWCGRSLSSITYVLTFDAAVEEDFNESNKSSDGVLGKDEVRSVPTISKYLIICDRSQSSLDAGRVCLTGNGSLALWSQDNPMNEGRDIWECVGNGVEDAEPCTITGGFILTRWREEFLHASGSSLGAAGVMRIVEVHEAPSLCRLGIAMAICDKNLQRPAIGK